MEPVGAFLETCRLVRKQTHRNLTVFALLGEKVFDPDYLLLETALAEGLVEIRELGPESSVPELRLVNRAEGPVLIVDGEGLVGAKQDYAVNVTITSLVVTSINRTLSVWPSHGVLAGEHPPENAMRFFW